MKNRSFFYKIFLFILLLPLLAGCRQSSPATEAETPDSSTEQAEENKTYTNDEYGFSLEYPADWSLKELTEFEKNTGVIVIFEGPESAEYGYSTNIMIKANEWPPDATTEQYAEAFETQILKKNLPDYVSLGERTASIGGVPAIVRTFTATMQNTPCKDIQAYFTNGGYAYAITYQSAADCYDTYTGCYDLVAGTFTFR